MKIAIFLPNATFDLPGSPEVGGIETFSFTVGEALQRLGYDVTLFGGQPKPGRVHRATTLQLSLHPYWETRSIPDLGTRFQRLVQRLHFASRAHRAFARGNFDLLLLAKPFDWPVAWVWKRRRPRLRVIMGFHGEDFFTGDRAFYGTVDAAFAVSAHVAALAESRVHRRPEIIPNPVDVDFFSPLGRTQPSGENWHLVSSGRLVGWKGFANVIEATARLRDEHGIIARLSLAGDGPERESLARLIDAHHLGAQVKLTGLLSREALRDLLRTADLYVQPSIGLESFSISALEGACTGLPLVLSDQVGLASFLTPQDFATYPARDLAALVLLLKKLHACRYDPPWVDAAARHARLREQFAPERIARRILDLVA